MGLTAFFKRRLTLARVSGIPVRADARWFFVLILLAWITAAYIPPNLVADNLTRFFLGFLTTLVFFVSILLHELAHAVVARLENTEVVEIVLHPFGGLARFRHAPETARAEFCIAIAGPAASLLLAISFLGLTLVFNRFGENVVSPLVFILFLWNLLLGIFNLLPGYPLDGGRVLRAYLWHSGRDLNEATLATGRAGQIIAVTLMVVGLLIAVGRGDLFTGLWTIVIGFFLFAEAKAVIKQTSDLQETLVAEAMSLAHALAPDDNLLHFVDNILPRFSQTAFPVGQNKHLYGILTLEDLKEIPRENWHRIRIRDAMRPVTTEHFVEADSFLSDARRLMRENGIGAVGVIDDRGKLIGFLQSSRLKKKN